ncbi:hypothetical protein [Winogradskyella flava]|uniref:hypothetical protein n=1 Tax=Winogradskyella flava TaxID=1884876 RepID=UPI00249036B1|nr:hypothetical protein [Winogradskyella flava]
MNIQTIKIQSELTKELDKTFGDFIQTDISLISDAIYRFIPNKIENILTENTNDIIVDSSADYNKIKTIQTKICDLQIRIQESIQNSNELLVAYIPIKSKDGQETKTESIGIFSYGRYDKITIIHPIKFNIELDIVLEYSKIIIEGCYNWFFQKLKTIIKENTIVSSYIYSKLKTFFPNKPEIYKSIWLVVVNNNSVTYLLDEENIEYALSKIKSYNLTKVESPIKQVNEFINMNIKYESTFMREVAAAYKGLSVNPLENPVYSKSDEYSNLLAIGEAGIWEEDSTGFPILIEGKFYLFTIFPTKYLKEIEPVLIENREYISNEFKKLRSRISKLLKMMNRKNYDLGEIGKFAGNFLGGFFNSMNQ